MALTAGRLLRFADHMGWQIHVFLGAVSSMPVVATFLPVIGSLWAERTGKNKADLLPGLLVHGWAGWSPRRAVPGAAVFNAASSALLFVFSFVGRGQPGARRRWTTWMATSSRRSAGGTRQRIGWR